MAPLSDLRPGQRLPERPAGYAQRAVWVNGKRALKVGYLDTQGADGGSSFTVSCSPERGTMRSVAVFRGDDQYTEQGSKSPTQLYGKNRTSLVWRRGAVRRERQPSYDQACREGETSVVELLQPFRTAVARGQVAVVPISSQGDGDRQFLATLIEEYAFEVGRKRQRAKLGGADAASVPSVVYHRGGSHFFGVDLDGNQELDVLVARHERSGRQVFLYDLERAPERIRQAIPKVAGRPEEPVLSFPCSPGRLSEFEQQACGGFGDGFFIPPAPREHDPQEESGEQCRVCACVKFKHPAGYISIVSSTSPRAPVPFRGEITVLYGRYDPAVNRRDEVPHLLPVRSHELPSLPEGEVWLPDSFQMEGPRWISADEGLIEFQIQTARRDGSRSEHRFRIRFTRLSDCDVSLSAIEPYTALR